MWRSCSSCHLLYWEGPQTLSCNWSGRCLLLLKFPNKFNIEFVMILSNDFVNRWNAICFDWAGLNQSTRVFGGVFVFNSIVFIQVHDDINDMSGQFYLAVNNLCPRRRQKSVDHLLARQENFEDRNCIGNASYSRRRTASKPEHQSLHQVLFRKIEFLSPTVFSFK